VRSFSVLFFQLARLIFNDLLYVFFQKNGLTFFGTFYVTYPLSIVIRHTLFFALKLFYCIHFTKKKKCDYSSHLCPLTLDSEMPSEVLSRLKLAQIFYVPWHSRFCRLSALRESGVEITTAAGRQFRSLHNGRVVSVKENATKPLNNKKEGK